MMNQFKFLVLISLPVLFFSCSEKLGPDGYGYNGAYSPITGIKYGAPGEMMVHPNKEQKTAPGLVLIEGGTFLMGANAENISYEWNNIPRRVTISSFYMDETEIRNVDYREYLFWLAKVHGGEENKLLKMALPDTLVWRNPLSYNEPFVIDYLRHPSYSDFPVVGVSWVQATEFCNWRSDRVNEVSLIKEGYAAPQEAPTTEEYFTTEGYLAGLYTPTLTQKQADAQNKKTSKPKKGEEAVPAAPALGDDGRVTREMGILQPKYRLPTEAEWEYAAVSLTGETSDGVVKNSRSYPWNGTNLRNSAKGYEGRFRANFKLGNGDMMGLANSLNDNASITTFVRSYWPNDFGLYNMAGNVNEWVQDVYRASTNSDVEDFRPFRGNVFLNMKVNELGVPIFDEYGRVQYDTVQNANRLNYETADNINAKDGDAGSVIDYDGLDSAQLKKAYEDQQTMTKKMYNYGKTSLVSDKARVYKGGSWKDLPYWLSPGNRRFLQEYLSTDDIGFRCSMERMGSPSGTSGQSDNKNRVVNPDGSSSTYIQKANTN